MHDSVSNHQLHDCLLSRIFRRRSKKTSKLHVTGLCAGNSPLTGEFPAQMHSNSENVSIWWRHHVALILLHGQPWHSLICSWFYIVYYRDYHHWCCTSRTMSHGISSHFIASVHMGYYRFGLESGHVGLIILINKIIIKTWPMVCIGFSFDCIFKQCAIEIQWLIS